MCSNTCSAKPMPYRVPIRSQPNPGRKQTTATKTYNTTKTYGVQTTGIYSCCFQALSLGIVFLGRCSSFPSKVGLRSFQHPGTCSSITSFTYACHTDYSKSYTVMIHNTSLLYADRKGRICTLLPYLVSIYEQKLITVIECLNFMFEHHVFLVTVQGM